MSTDDRLVSLVAYSSASSEADMSSIPAFGVAVFGGRVIPVT